MRAAALLACAAVLCLLAAADRASAQNTAPGKPAIADSGVTAAAQTLTVTWTAPSTTGGAAITAYDVRHIRTNSLDKATDAAWTVVDDAWTSTGGGALSYAITGLRDSASHDIQVRAVNSVGDGDWSDVATATTTDINQVTGQLNTTHLARVEPANDRDRFTFRVTVATRVWFYTSGALNADLKLYTTPVTAGKRPLSSSSSSRWIEGLKGASIAYTLAANTTYALSVGSAGSAHVGDVEVHASVTPTAGTAIASAPTLTLGQAIQGNIASPGGMYGEHEYFKFVLGATTDIWIVTFGGLQGGRYSAASNRLILSELQDSTGTAIETAGFGGWYGALWTSDIRRQLAAGTYYVDVYGSSSYPGHHGDYELIVREYKPAGSTRATAAPAQLHGHSPGDFPSATDTDYFSMDLAVPQLVDIYVTERGATQTGESDPVFTIRAYDADGGDIAILSRSRIAGLFYDNVETKVRTYLPTGRSYIQVSSNMASGKYVITPFEVIAQPDMVRACPRGQQSDAFYHCQWHLNNTGQYSLGNGTDINVEEVWATNKGAGITIAIVDAGVQLDHEDLRDNVDTSLSHNYGGGFTQSQSGSSHGTGMAGLAAARDNLWGVRGVAPRATFYSLKLTSSPTDANILDSLTRNLAATAVTSNSWSLTPAGSPIAAGAAWEMAAERGATRGFGGKGTVYVFAAGNNHGRGDNANLNGLANFHTSVTACAIGHDGQRASYSERGASLWVCAPSNGSPGPALTSTDVNNRYTRNAVGTSAATPVVAGVVALIRAANTNLTARDVKLILAASAVKNHPGSSSWQQGALKYGSTTERYSYSHDYGFGLVDAGAAVTLAKAWTTNLPAQRTSEVASGTLGSNIGEAPRDGAAGTSATSTLTLDSYVKFIEYIEVKVTIDHRSARDLQIQLRSPSGAVSTLAYAATRSQFRSLRGQPVRFPEAFRFGSARHVGESAAGAWTLTVQDGLTGNTGSLTSWSIKAYGHGSSPGYPDAPTATAGTRSLTVDWAAPSETGPTAITGYDLRYIRSSATGKTDPNNWTVVTGIGTDDTASYSLTGLGAGAEYDVQVRAVNTGGAGPWSESLVIRSTLEKPFVSSLTAVNPRDRALGAIWTAPAEDGGSEITSYDLHSIRSDATDEQKAIATNWAEELSAWTTGELRANIASLTNGVQYDVQVRARNTIGAGDWSATRTGTPAVQNTDPSFADATTTREVAENVGVGANVGARVGATDPDSGDTLTYSISGTSDLFEINEANGQLSVKAALDHETGPSHSLTVQVSDGLNSSDDVDPTIDDTIGVTINVTDVNEAPAIMGPAAISRDENGGTSLANAEYVATDPEMKDITWSLAGNDWLDFTIDDGTLSFASEPDFEAPADHDGDNVYQVTVQATDEGGVAGRLPVTVTVEDVNEPPVISGSAALSLEEEGVVLVGTYTVTDPEEAAIAWLLLAGDDSEKFEFTTTSGRLRLSFKAAPDYDDAQDSGTDNVYDVIVSASAGGDTATQAVAVTITDKDEPAAVTASRGSGVTGTGSNLIVDENHSGTVATFAASDPENDATLTYTWSVAGTDRLDFSISTSGVLTFAATPDYERPADAAAPRNVYNITVSALDSDGKTGSTTVTVTVTNVNEPPVVGGPKTISWSENRTGTLGTYTRRDPDRPAQTTSWGPVGSSTVLSGANSAAFAFDQSTGRLTFESAPDYEDGGGQYEVTLTANDGSREGMLGVTVTVANLDEFVRDPVTFDARTPVINRTLTATLTDPDTIVSSAWTWQRSTSRTSGWSDIAGATSNIYPVVADDRGNYLRASVTYEDGHGTGKAGDASTEFVAVNERLSNTAPELPATVGDISIAENTRPGSNAGSPVLAQRRRGRPADLLGQRRGRVRDRQHHRADPGCPGRGVRLRYGHDQLRPDGDGRRRLRRYRHRRRHHPPDRCERSADSRRRRGDHPGRRAGHDRRAGQRQRPRGRPQRADAERDASAEQGDGRGERPPEPGRSGDPHVHAASQLPRLGQLRLPGAGRRQPRAAGHRHRLRERHRCERRSGVPVRPGDVHRIRERRRGRRRGHARDGHRRRGGHAHLQPLRRGRVRDRRRQRPDHGGREAHVQRCHAGHLHRHGRGRRRRHRRRRHRQGARRRDHHRQRTSGAAAGHLCRRRRWRRCRRRPQRPHAERGGLRVDRRARHRGARRAATSGRPASGPTVRTLWHRWRTASGADDELYAYDLGERASALEEREFALDETNRAPRGIWGDRADRLGLRQRARAALRLRPGDRRARRGARVGAASRQPRRARHLVRRRDHVGARREERRALRLRPRQRRAAGRVRAGLGEQRPARHLVRRRHRMGLRPRGEAAVRLPAAHARGGRRRRRG